MATTKKTKQRPASAAAKKAKPRKPVSNGKQQHAVESVEKLIATLDIKELNAIVAKIEKRKDELYRTANEDNPSDFFNSPVVQDWKWVYEQCNAGKLQDYLGTHIAVMDRQILGSHENAIVLRDSLAKKHHVDGERIVIFYNG